MHGSTGDIGMYQQNLLTYASHGFVVVFPYVKDPKADRSSFTTNINGEFILRGIDYANFSTTVNVTSPLYGMVDTSSIVVVGHSMGAMDSIMAALRTAKGDPRVAPGSLKLMVTQHPFVCGPFGDSQPQFPCSVVLIHQRTLPDAARDG